MRLRVTDRKTPHHGDYTNSILLSHKARQAREGLTVHLPSTLQRYEGHPIQGKLEISLGCSGQVRTLISRSGSAWKPGIRTSIFTHMTLVSPISARMKSMWMGPRTSLRRSRRLWGCSQSISGISMTECTSWFRWGFAHAHAHIHTSS